MLFVFFFFNDTATTEIYTLSLHDALPICRSRLRRALRRAAAQARHPEVRRGPALGEDPRRGVRSEEHTSELQSLAYLVCRLLLEKKKKNINAQRHRFKLLEQITQSVSRPP